MLRYRSFVTFTDDMTRVIGNALRVDTSQVFSVGFGYGGANQRFQLQRA